MICVKREHGRRFLLVSGPRLKVEIIPELGGRISRLSRTGSSYNHMLKEGALLRSGSNNPGGISELLSPDGETKEPGDLMFFPFQYETFEDDTGVVIQLRSQLGTFLVEKDFLISNYAPCLRQKIRYTNVSNTGITSGITTCIRMKGQRKKVEDRVLFYPDESTVKETFIKFNNGIVNLGAGGWSAFQHLKSGEGLFVIYDHKQVQKSIGKSFPVHTSMIVEGKSRYLNPGESVEASFEYWLPDDSESRKYMMKQQGLLNGSGKATCQQLVKQLDDRSFLDRMQKRNLPLKLLPKGGKGQFSFHFDQCVQKKGRLEVPAGSTGVWKFKFRAETPIEEGGSILIKRCQSTPFALITQTDDPQQEDFTQIKTNASAKLVLSFPLVESPTRSWHRQYKNMALCPMIGVKKGRLAAGDEVVMTIGQRKKGLMTSNLDLRSQTGKGEIPDYGLEVFIDESGAQVYKRVGDKLKCLLVPGNPARIVAVVDTIADQDGKVEIVVRIEDLHANLCNDYKGTLKIEPSNLKGLPGKITLSKHDGGFVKLSAFVTDKREIAWCKFIDEEKGIYGLSNTILSKKINDQYNIYWGELHAHTNWSHDGRGDIDDAMKFGRDIAKLDFTAITDHTIVTMDTQALPEKVRDWWRKTWWQAHRKVCTKYAVPERFVPILAQECHPGDGGDHNIFYPDYKTPLILPLKTTGGGVCRENAYKKLYREVAEKNCLIIPHVGGGGKSWDYHDDNVEPLAEIASIHGRFEGFCQEALRRGYKVGFVYGSDFHCGTPGSSGFLMSPGKFRLPRYKSFQDCNGFTAVLANDLSADTVMDALRKRRCYAVMGQSRIILEFSVNGEIMGGSLTSSERPEIRVSVIGSEKIRSITLIRGESLAYLHKGESSAESFIFTDANVKKGMNYYYIRVIQENDDLAWSSPVWVYYTGRENATQLSEEPWDLEEVRDLDDIQENEATQYEEMLEIHLKRLTGGRFHGIKGVRIVNHSYGRYALFFGYDGFNNDTHTHFMFMLDYDPFTVGVAYNWQIYNSLLSPEHAMLGGVSPGKR